MSYKRVIETFGSWQLVFDGLHYAIERIYDPDEQREIDSCMRVASGYFNITIEEEALQAWGDFKATGELNGVPVEL